MTTGSTYQQWEFSAFRTCRIQPANNIFSSDNDDEENDSLPENPEYRKETDGKAAAQ